MMRFPTKRLKRWTPLPRTHRAVSYLFLDHILTNEPRLLAGFIQLLGKQASPRIQERLGAFYTGTEDADGLRVSMLKLLEGLG